ncbi:hypothetical protein C2S51_016961 [Perilla frutescens var. frutescens]|nr:hypothetical protein C2S51_016961 [Perilla frutescens var. frutescens]
MAGKIALDGVVDHEVWFRIGGTNLRFSPTDYALVTGLMVGGSDFDPYIDHHIPRLIVGIIPVELTVKKRAYHFYGLVWALQILAYEAISRVGRHCAHLVSDIAIPRYLKWKFSDKVVRIGTLFIEGHLLCHVFLFPTENERDLPYFRSTLFEDAVGVPYVVKRQPKNRISKVTYARTVTPSRRPTPPRVVTPPRVSTPPRAVTPHRAPTPPRGPTPATSAARSTSRRSADCLPRTCGETGAVDTVTGLTSGHHRGKRVRASTSSSSMSEGHICCCHMDRYREIVREAAHEAARKTASLFQVELKKRLQTTNERDEGLFNQLKDFLIYIVKQMAGQHGTTSPHVDLAPDDEYKINYVSWHLSSLESSLSLALLLSLALQLGLALLLVPKVGRDD